MELNGSYPQRINKYTQNRHMHNIDFSIKNGWILSLVWIIISYAPMFFGGKAAKRLTNFSWMGKKNWFYSSLIWILSILFLVIPVFSSITKNSTLLVIGWGLMLLGGIGTLISYQNYFTTPLDQLITKGLYTVSRNPIYVFVSIGTAGIAVLCTSYFIGVALIINLLLQHPVILEEEKFCSDTYGKDYINYKKQTRRYL